MHVALLVDKWARIEKVESVGFTRNRRLATKTTSIIIIIQYEKYRKLSLFLYLVV